MSCLAAWKQPPEITMDEKCLVYHKEGLKRAKADPEHSHGTELKMILKWCVRGLVERFLSSYVLTQPETV